MRVAILGAGAMGSVFGARLFMGGADITLLDVNQAHLDAINSDGLRVSLDDGDHRLELKACSPEDYSGDADLILLFTKVFHTASALSAISDKIGDAYVLSLQNGIGNGERVASIVPKSQVLIGMTMTPAEFNGPGHVSSHGTAGTDFFSLDGERPPGLLAIRDMMRLGGIEAKIEPEIENAIWEKAAFNCALNALCGLARVPVGTIGRSDAGRALAMRVINEVDDVARARGMNIDLNKIEKMVAHAVTNHINHEPSMMQDLVAGRRTEIDALNGAIAALGQTQSVATPVNQALSDLVHLAEQGYENPT
jgi:2-dehydropantoate 2-reductase